MRQLHSVTGNRSRWHFFDPTFQLLGICNQLYARYADRQYVLKLAPLFFTCQKVELAIKFESKESEIIQLDFCILQVRKLFVGEAITDQLEVIQEVNGTRSQPLVLVKIPTPRVKITYSIWRGLNIYIPFKLWNIFTMLKVTKSNIPLEYLLNQFY